MKKIVITGRLVLATSLLFWLGSCYKAEDKSRPAVLVFPFYNKIYTYASTASAPEAIHQSTFRFTKNYYYSGKNCWMSGNLRNSTQKSLIKYSPAEAQETVLLEGDYQNIIPLAGMVVTIDTLFSPPEGFRYNIYTLSADKFKQKPVFSTHLDLFISDTELISDRIFCCGSNRADTTHSLYCIDPLEKKLQLLFSAPKNRDFMKLILTDQKLVFYLSSQDWSNRGNIRLLYYLLENLSTDIPPGPPGEILTSGLSKYYAAFGKGFSEKENIFLPVIDAQYNCSLIKISPPPKLELPLYNLPTGLYCELPSPLSAPADKHYYIGYNYYREKSQFYFMSLPLHPEDPSHFYPELQPLPF